MTTSAGFVMLSDVEMQRIREEEIYRSEVRASLVPQTPAQEPRIATALWKFLNTSVGGWLLTTVLAGFIVWLATTYQESRDAARQRAATLEAVKLEVGYRILAAERAQNPQNARDKLDDVFIDPQYSTWDFGSVLYQLGDVSGAKDKLIDEVLHFKASGAAGDDFRKRLAALRGKLEDNHLIAPPPASKK